MQHMDELAEIAMTAHHQQGEHDKALEAARLIRSVPRQAAKLQTLGYWKELADLTQVTLTSSCPAWIHPDYACAAGVTAGRLHTDSRCRTASIDALPPFISHFHLFILLSSRSARCFIK